MKKKQEVTEGNQNAVAVHTQSANSTAQKSNSRGENDNVNKQMQVNKDNAFALYVQEQSKTSSSVSMQQQQLHNNLGANQYTTSKPSQDQQLKDYFIIDTNASSHSKNQINMMKQHPANTLRPNGPLHPASTSVFKKQRNSNMQMVQASQDSQALRSAIEQNSQIRSPSNIDFQPFKEKAVVPTTFTTSAAEHQQNNNGQQSSKQFMTPKNQNKVRLGSQLPNSQTNSTEQNLVQASALFNARPDKDNSPKVSVITKNHTVSRKVTFPNLNPKHSSNHATAQHHPSNSLQTSGGLGVSQSSTKLKDYSEKKSHHRGATEESSALNLVRGLQNDASREQDGMNVENSQKLSSKAKESHQLNNDPTTSNTFSYRKRSQQQAVKDHQKLQSNTNFSNTISPSKRKNGAQRAKMQSYGQLPQIEAAANKAKNLGSTVSSNTQVDLHRIREDRLHHQNLPANNRAKVFQQDATTNQNFDRTSATNSALKQYQQSQQTTQDINLTDFHQWYKTPNFQMQGKQLLDPDQIKQTSLEALHKIRAKAALAPSSGSKAAGAQKNQFQPQGMKHQMSRNNILLGPVTAANKMKTMTTGKSSSLALTAQGNQVQSLANQSQQPQQTRNDRSNLKVSATAHFNTILPAAGHQQPIKQYQGEKPPMAPQQQQQHLNNPSDLEMSRYQHYSGAGTNNQTQIGNTSADYQVQNLSGNNSHFVVQSRAPSQLNQEQQINSTVTSQQKVQLSQHQASSWPGTAMDLNQEQNEQSAAAGGSGAEINFISKSQLNAPLQAVDDDGMMHSDSNVEASTPASPSKKDLTKFVSTKSVSNKPPIKKSDKHVRQFSQAQRQNRNSVVGGRGRLTNTGKGDHQSNTRQVVMNSPLMQPPPQILQSKVIIHLLKTEYILIEQVAKQEMNWRVTKSENPNAEFDVYWNDIGIDSDKLASLKPYQKTNHFPAMYQITRKTFLAKNLKRLQKLYPLEFNFFPKTWTVPNEMNELRTYASQRQKKVKREDSQIKKKPSQIASGLSKSNETQQLQATSAPGTATTPAVAQSTEPEVAEPQHEIARNGFQLSNPTPAPPVKPAEKKPSIIEQLAEESGSDAASEEKESADEESNESTSEQPPFKESAMANSGQQNQAIRKPVLREQRKAPLNSKCSRKARFPMIVKPDCSSQGKGIFLTHDIDAIPKDDTYVVQQYMQSPYLIDGLKFDLRLYVLVLSCEPLKIFLYEEGLVRFATQPYKPIDPNADKKELNNLFMHLTNYAINKESDQFRGAKSMEDGTGHKRTLKKVLAQLKQEGLDPDKIMGEIKDVIVKTMITIQSELAHNYRTCQPADLESLMCFELLGFDIILDDKGKPVLLEINQAPSFATDSPLDYEIKHGVFVDMFNLLGLSVDKKKQKLRRLYEEKKDRMMTKLTLKQKNQMRRQAINEFRKDQDVFETENHGRFEKIYPLPIKQASESNQNCQDDETLSQTQKQLSQSQYQALVRQQERYNQLLATLANTDIEKAIRAKNRNDDVKAKDDKDKAIKLKLKKTEKKRLESQVLQARQTSQQKKSGVLQQQNHSSAAVRTENTLDEGGLRKSSSKLFSHPAEAQSQSSKLRQSCSDRLNDNKSQTTNTHTHTNINTQNHVIAYNQGGHQSGASFSIKHQPQQLQQQPQHSLQQQNYQNRQNFRESINGLNLDQNTQLRHLIEMQQKIATNMPNGSKGGGYNLVNLGISAQNFQSLTGRTASTKKQMMVSDYLASPHQQIDGLKPQVKQLSYQQTTGNISQSQNPISLNPNKLKSGEYEMKMNRTQGQTTSTNANRQGNLLPNIARNMMPAEKSAPGFQSQQNSGQPIHPQQQNEYGRGNSKNKQRFRGSAGPFDQKTPGQMALAAAQQQNSVLNSPVRAGQIVNDRSNFQRNSIQQASGQKNMQIKTQHMNLGVMNIQPVIIDSNHFNSENAPLSPSKQIPIGGGSSYKTQKFSKIQLQTIIDNLYQYEGKGQTVQGGGVPNQTMSKQPLSPKDLSKTTQFKPGSLQSQANTNQKMMHLPEVNQNEIIQKQSSNIANLALEAIANSKNKQAIGVTVLGSPPDSRDFSTVIAGSPRRISSSGRKLVSSEAKYGKDQTDPSKFSTHRGKVQTMVGADAASFMPTKKSSIIQSPVKTSGGQFVIQGSSFKNSEQRQQFTQHVQSQQVPGGGGSVGQTTTATGNVLNFNNCNVTIINNNFEGTPGSTIIQSSLNSKQIGAMQSQQPGGGNNNNMPVASKAVEMQAVSKDQTCDGN